MNGREGKKGRKGKQTLISYACCCLSEVKLVKNTPHCPFLLLLPGGPAKAFTQALTVACVPWLCHLLSGGTFS